MNYLAHLLIAEHTQSSLIGNFLGDFVKGPVERLEYSEDIKQGIRLHRAIDTFTDTHAVFLQSKSRMTPARRRYAGIIIDLAYDHFLSISWSEFAGSNREAFIAGFYVSLEENMRWLPERCSRMAKPMILSDWIGRYAHLEGVSDSLNGISGRINRQFKRDNPLYNAIEEVESNYEALHQDFLAFFPKLIQFSEKKILTFTEKH